MTITKDMLVAIVRRHIDLEPAGADLLAGRIFDAIEATEKVTKQRAALDREFVEERSRHVDAMNLIQARLRELRAACQHPATELHRGVLAGESYRECVLCGGEIAGK